MAIFIRYWNLSTLSFLLNKSVLLRVSFYNLYVFHYKFPMQGFKQWEYSSMHIRKITFIFVAIVRDNSISFMIP